jgi:hypothetical protein
MGYFVLLFGMSLFALGCFFALRSHLRTEVMREYNNNRDNTNTTHTVMNFNLEAGKVIGLLYGVIVCFYTSVACITTLWESSVGIEHFGGKFTGNIINGGFYASYPWTNITSYSTKRQSISISGKDKDDAALSKDQYFIFYEVNFPYSLNRDMVYKIWLKIGDTDSLTEKMKKHAISSLKEVVAKYDFMNLTQNYDKVSNDVFLIYKQKLIADFQALGFSNEESNNLVMLSGIDIIRMQPDENIINAITKKKIEGISKQ